MVANQATKSKLGYKIENLEKILVKLKFDKKNKLSKNQNKWDEKLRNVFATANLTYFLGKYSSLSAPADMVAELLLLRASTQHVTEARKKKASAKKLFKDLKVEGGESSDDDKPEKDYSSSSDSTSEAESDRKFEELLAAQTKMILEDIRANRNLAVSRGVRAETVFLNPFTAVPLRFSSVNPEAVIELGDEKGGIKVYEVESENMRLQRQVAWQLLVSSIKEVDDALWDHIPNGNVYALYNLLTTNFLDTERAEVVDDLTSKFATLSKSEGELFVNFYSRYKALIVRKKEVDMKMDHDTLYNYVEQALMRSDSVTQEMFELISVQQDRFSTPEALLDKMGKLMQKREKKDRKSKQSANGASNKNKQKNELSRARALVAEADNQSDDSWRGVCVYFQKGTCLKGSECKFKHRKLKKQDVEKLEKLVSNSKKKKEKAKVRAAVVKPEKANTQQTDTKSVMKMVTDLVSDAKFSEAELKSLATALLGATSAGASESKKNK